MTTTPLCIYHHGCADGIAAAWVVREHFAKSETAVEFHPGIYGEAPPDVTGRDVILVDFSYKRPVLLQMAEQAKSLLVIDHHKSAMKDLLSSGPVVGELVFSLGNSGAMLAWEHYNPGRPAPLLIQHIEDHDLWRFTLSQTREIVAAVYSYPLTLSTFDDMITRGILPLIAEGTTLIRKQQADIAAILRDATRQMRFGDYIVPAANVPWMYASDVGHALSKDQPFAVTYYDDADGRRFSLRSQPDGIDVAVIAEALGGGGHKHAAGFRMTREEAIDFEVAGGL